MHEVEEDLFAWPGVIILSILESMLTPNRMGKLATPHKEDLILHLTRTGYPVPSNALVRRGGLKLSSKLKQVSDCQSLDMCLL